MGEGQEGESFAAIKSESGILLFGEERADHFGFNFSASNFCRKP